MADILSQEEISWLLEDVGNYELEDCVESLTDATVILKEHNEYIKVPYRVFHSMVDNLRKLKKILELERAERIKANEATEGNK